MEQVATLEGQEDDAAACRHLAHLLHLDAVGVVRLRDGHRRVVWWAAPDTEVAPVDRILQGEEPDWVTVPHGERVVFAHLTNGDSARSVSTLSAMLIPTTAEPAGPSATDLGGVAPEDPVERERAHLAYAIHDGLTQVVTASVLDLEWNARRAEVTPSEAVDALSDAASRLREALDEIRALLASLSSPGGAPAQPLEDLVQGVLERWRLPAEWSVEGDLNGVPEPILDAASSVIRESVANAAKHAASREVAVRVRASRAVVEVRVEDQGRGFRPECIGEHAGHLGLEMMRRRVAEVNGTLKVESSPGTGTRVVARLPVSGQGAKS
ncbi:MAG TPA: ATP-binding protein [Actinomycetota bacterium]|nr:ATP-binding protein [Actinomycetota bacterium]